MPASAELPRFTLRQMVLGSNRVEPRIPGAWLRAATRIAPESLAVLEYREAAGRIGIEPLGGDVLAAERSQHVMGLYRRGQLIAASQRTLEAIRNSIPSDIVRARFDRIFRPKGRWIVDLHDAALAWAQSRAPGIGWGTARAALTATHWLAPTNGEPDAQSYPRALYGLAVLAATDSAAYVRATAALWRADSASAGAAMLLLKGYTESQRWYADAVNFFVQQPWVPEAGGQSLEDFVRREWRAEFAAEDDPPLPRIETRWFGYPQAVPHYGTPSALFHLLVQPENPGASEWLEREGEGGVLRLLRWLPPGDTTLTLLRTARTTLRLSTVSRQSRESLNGFLEPEDAIVIDPGYSPLLAIGAVVHEWQHLLFRRRQLERFAKAPVSRTELGVRLPGVQPYLAEGFAEWGSERILQSVTDRWPLLTLGELEKRADLSQRGGQDQHALGYALVSALFSEVRDSRKTTQLLLSHAEDPAAIAQDPALRKAWRAPQREQGAKPQSSAWQVLIPEVTFTVEDDYPDVVATRILVPPGYDPSR